MFQEPNAVKRKERIENNMLLFGLTREEAEKKVDAFYLNLNRIKGTLLNADVNGALNILKKSNVVSLDALYNSGEVDTPIRIRIA